MVVERTAIKSDGVVEVSVRRVMRAGTASVEQAAIQDECGVSLHVNGERFTWFGCTGSHLDELAVGHLRTEGVIASRSQVVALRVGGGAITVVANMAEESRKPSEPAVPVAWSSSAVFRIADEFALDKTAHARTRGAHSAFLCDLDGAILCMREDIGRHNAFDKVVGWALLHDVDLSRCMLYTSGRVPCDMAMKAIRAGIPILISKSVATDQGIDLARAHGLTLICEASPKCFHVMSEPGPDRDADEASGYPVGGNSVRC